MSTRELESLAVRASLPFATVYAIAKGRTKNPTARTLEPLSAALSEEPPREFANG
jgi:transcriptional regulator with XRE-family HTH domain